MRRLLQPFVLAVSAVLMAGYAYLAWRLASSPWQRLALAVPFVLVWIVPVMYWVEDRDSGGFIHELIHAASYLSMGWLSFLFVLALARDALLLATGWTATLLAAHGFLLEFGVPVVLVVSFVAMAAGALVALRGPPVRHIDIPVEGLHPDLEGWRIAQVSDLHVGLFIRARYVERVVETIRGLEPDIIALTGDIVDGSVERLARHVAALGSLARQQRAFFVLGNHDCYSGAGQWIAHFRQLGLQVLLNSHAIVVRGEARVLVAGVVDPALRMTHPGLEPRPDIAAGDGVDAAFRLLLAHNPKIAPLGDEAGFDLQLSGHTHAGQFFPWTFAVHLVHAPHVAGLSRQGRMWVYVSAGTGTWGPPLRFGSQPELTLLRLICVPTPSHEPGARFNRRCR